MSSSQCSPVNPSAHVHTYPEAVTVHVPPFSQGSSAQASPSPLSPAIPNSPAAPALPAAPPLPMTPPLLAAPALPSSPAAPAAGCVVPPVPPPAGVPPDPTGPPSSPASPLAPGLIPPVPTVTSSTEAVSSPHAATNDRAPTNTTHTFKARIERASPLSISRSEWDFVVGSTPAGVLPLTAKRFTLRKTTTITNRPANRQVRTRGTRPPQRGARRSPLEALVRTTRATRLAIGPRSSNAEPSSDWPSERFRPRARDPRYDGVRSAL